MANISDLMGNLVSDEIPVSDQPLAPLGGGDPYSMEGLQTDLNSIFRIMGMRGRDIIFAFKAKNKPPWFCSKSDLSEALVKKYLNKKFTNKATFNDFCVEVKNLAIERQEIVQQEIEDIMHEAAAASIESCAFIGETEEERVIYLLNKHAQVYNGSDERMYFASPNAGSLYERNSSTLNASFLAILAPQSYWVSAFMNQSITDVLHEMNGFGYWPEICRHVITHVSSLVPVELASLTRGAGYWYSKNDGTGKSVITANNGNLLTIYEGDQFKTIPRDQAKDGKFYPRSEPHFSCPQEVEGEGVDIYPFTQEMYFDIKKLAEKIPWVKSGSANIFMGFAMSAKICAVNVFRPHLGVSAPSLSGKSSVVSALLKAIFGQLVLPVNSKSSEPSIRRSLLIKGVPLIMEEVERNKDTDKALNVIFDALLKCSYSRTERQQIRYTSNTGAVIVFEPNCQVALIGTNVDPAGRQRMNRMIILNMSKPTMADKSQKNTLPSQIETLADKMRIEDWPSKMGHFLASNFSKIEANQRLFQRLLKPIIETRYADSFSVIYAYEAICSQWEKLLTEEEALALIKEYQPNIFQDYETATNTTFQEFYSGLMSIELKMESGAGRKNFQLRKWLELRRGIDIGDQLVGIVGFQHIDGPLTAISDDGIVEPCWPDMNEKREIGFQYIDEMLATVGLVYNPKISDQDWPLLPTFKGDKTKQSQWWGRTEQVLHPEDYRQEGLFIAFMPSGSLLERALSDVHIDLVGYKTILQAEKYAVLPVPNDQIHVKSIGQFKGRFLPFSE